MHFFRPRRPNASPGFIGQNHPSSGRRPVAQCPDHRDRSLLLRRKKGSHASLGYTEKRKALFLDGGHIYMYYARGGDSLNFSAQGPGNAVLIKSAYPWVDELSGPASLAQMLLNNPDARGRPRPSQKKLCAGQTLLCRALGLKVPVWDAKRFDHEVLLVEDVGPAPGHIIQTTRLGIPHGRDEHLMYRFC